MKLKRNDPCHCGSGKKYKQCHMREDQAAKSVSQDPVSVQVEETPSRPPREESPSLSSLLPDFDTEFADADLEHLDEPWSGMYSQFAKANYDGKKSILWSAVEGDVLDEETLFDFFNELYPYMMAKGDEREFLELAALTKSRHPDAYFEESHWFWEWNMEAALKAENGEALQAITDELIEDGNADLEHFFPNLSRLLYHGKLETLVNAINKFDPEADFDDYFEEADDTYQDALGYLLLLNYIETYEQEVLLEEGHLDQLCRQVARYTESIEREETVDFVSRVGGLVSSTWSMDDFLLDPSKHLEEDGWYEDDDEEEAGDPAMEHFNSLGLEFVHYAHQAENIPRTKAYLAQQYLTEYFTLRQIDLILAEDAAQGWPDRKNSAKKRKQTDHTNLLLPNYVTTEEYLQRFYAWFANGTYQSMAFFMLLPTWIWFIESKGLAAPEECHQARTELELLRHAMEKGLSEHPDPKLVEHLHQWG